MSAIEFKRYWRLYDDRTNLICSMLKLMDISYSVETFKYRNVDKDLYDSYGTLFRVNTYFSKKKTKDVYELFDGGGYDKILKLKDDFEALDSQMIYEAAWTRIAIINEVAEFFKDRKKVLDIGSGVGKFVLIAAQLAKKTHFTGVEIAENYYNLSLTAKEKLNVKNASFIKDNFVNVDLTKFDGIYIFNPFIMSQMLQSQRDSIRHYEAAIHGLKKGTKLVMNCQDYEVPNSFEFIKNSNGANYYIKK